MVLISLGSIDYQEAKRIRSVFESQGVTLEVTVQPESCGKGCKPVADVFVEEEHLEKVRDFLAAEQIREHGGLLGTKHLEHVFDTANEDATCPACGTGFKTTLTECPDCGLVFIPPEAQE
jgi:hypothetical protein